MLARLQHDRIAYENRRGRPSDNLPQGIIPRRNAADDADGLPVYRRLGQGFHQREGQPPSRYTTGCARTGIGRGWRSRGHGSSNSLTMQSVSCGSMSLKYVSIFFMYSIRSDRGVAAQAGRAAAAAFAALSTSASFPAGTQANLSLFAGFLRQYELPTRWASKLHLCTTF